MFIVLLLAGLPLLFVAASVKENGLPAWLRRLWEWLDWHWYLWRGRRRGWWR